MILIKLIIASLRIVDTYYVKLTLIRTWYVLVTTIKNDIANQEKSLDKKLYSFITEYMFVSQDKYSIMSLYGTNIFR